MTPSRPGAVTLAAGHHEGKARRMTPVTLVTLLFMSCPKNTATHEIGGTGRSQVKTPFPHAATPGRCPAGWQSEQGGRPAVRGGLARSRSGGKSKGQNRGQNIFHRRSLKNRQGRYTRTDRLGRAKRFLTWGEGAKVTLFSHELKKKRHKRHSDRNPKQTQGFQRDASFQPMMSLPSFLPGRFRSRPLPP